MNVSQKRNYKSIVTYSSHKLVLVFLVWFHIGFQNIKCETESFVAGIHFQPLGCVRATELEIRRHFIIELNLRQYTDTIKFSNEKVDENLQWN